MAATRETEFGSFDEPCDDYDPGAIVDGAPVDNERSCVYCGWEKAKHEEFFDLAETAATL